MLNLLKLNTHTYETLPSAFLWKNAKTYHTKFTVLPKRRKFYLKNFGPIFLFATFKGNVCSSRGTSESDQFEIYSSCEL